MMLSEVEKDRIRNYKYRGGDSSPIYIHVLSPLAQFCVDTFVPKFVAPNVITVSGLILSILTGILALLYNPTLSRDAPRWLHLLTAITIFSYQTLDNMDGKQARRTGSSSALGMFFDHACDCINAGVTIVSMGSVMGTGWTPTFFITYLAAFYPFYGQTWEEFYSKEMVLPPFNGPTEGLLMSIGICLIAFVNGSDIFWIDLFNAPEYLLVPDDSLLNNFGYPSPSQPMVRPFALMFSIIICAVVYTAIVHVCSVISIVTRPDSHYSILSALYTLVPFLVYFPCLYIFGFCCEQGFKTNPISLAIMHCAVFAEMVMHAMIAHLLEREICVHQRYGAYIFAFITFLGISTGEETHSLQQFLVLFNMVFSMVTMLSTFIITCNQFAEACNIWVFKLGPRVKESAK